MHVQGLQQVYGDIDGGHTLFWFMHARGLQRRPGVDRMGTDQILIHVCARIAMQRLSIFAMLHISIHACARIATAPYPATDSPETF